MMQIYFQVGTVKDMIFLTLLVGYKKHSVETTQDDCVSGERSQNEECLKNTEENN